MTDPAKPPRLPDFLIVGTMKSATSSLADLLGRHPQCYVAPREVHFFNHDSRYEKGPAFYSTFFQDAGDALAVGEKTPSYSEHIRHPYIPRRIHETLGPVKLVWIFRNPVARTVSHYRHAVMQKAIRERFDTVIGRELDEGRYTAVPLVARSAYAQQVKLYLEQFPANLMHYCLFEDFIQDPAGVAKRVADFLGLDADVQNFSRGASSNRTGERSENQKQRAGLLGRFLLARRDKLLNSASPVMLERLAGHFAASNAELASLTGLDLSVWQSPSKR